ncbi:MAG: deoxyribose-phosphate aldolase [Myxococcota bacterium]
MSSPDPRELAAMIDHTLLKPDATEAMVGQLCDEALAHNFAGVCVNGVHIAYVARRLQGSSVLPVAVVGFPLGATTTKTKAYETQALFQLGAQEVDMVINIGALRAGDFRAVQEDIRAVVDAAETAAVKVIIETVFLDRDQKMLACAFAKGAGASFVKTSTGFGGGGATEEDVALMRATVGPSMGVKASGGIRDAATAHKMIAAGATRLGASASVAIIGC